MGRVLVKSSLPSKVLVKSNYAFDAFGNPVLLSTPSTSKGAPVRGERFAGLLGSAAGGALALTQPVNSLSQLINNIRYGAFEGGRDIRRLRRGLAGRREKIRANRAADIADKYAAMRTQEPLDQRRQRGLFDRLTGGNLRTTANQERELYEADERRRLADERAARNAALGQEVFNMAGGMRGERPEDLNLEQGQEALRNIRQLGVAGAQRGDRIDARESVPLPNFANQNAELIADINQEIQTRDVMPQEEDVNVTKPGAVRVVNASNQVEDLHPAQITPVLSGIPIPQQGASSAEKEEAAGTPAPNATVNTTMNTFDQMKPEPDEEEGEQQPSMLRTSIEEKMRGFGTEVEA